MPKKSTVVEDPAINEEELPIVQVKISLPREVYDAYKNVAEQQGVTTDELLAHRLTRCFAHASIRSLYFQESQLRQLERLLQVQRLDSSEQAIELIARAFKISLQGFDPIQVSPHIAKRIHLSAYGGVSPQQRLEQIITAALSRATGA